MRRGESGINLIVAVNKPCGLSSHDVVYRVRRAVGEKRVGHAGTLDPLATGVLLVGVGQATRLLGLLTLDSKAYRATIEFGTRTTTDDSEGEVIETVEVPACVSNEEFATRTLASIVGEQMQVPPAFSAISVDGKRAYALARSGQEVALEPRRICVNEARLVSVEAEGTVRWTCDFDVSKGTYVRSIARDLGALVGSAAHLAGLARLSAGTVTLDDCLSLDELAELGPEGVSSRALDPARVLGFPVRLLAQEELMDVQCGRIIEAGLVWDDGTMRPPRVGEKLSLVYGDKLMGVWECVGRQIHCTANFPKGVSGVRI